MVKQGQNNKLRAKHYTIYVPIGILCNSMRFGTPTLRSWKNSKKVVMTHTVCLIDTNKITRTSSGHFKFGVPCKQGVWPSNSKLAIKFNDIELQSAFCKVKQLWPDGTVKWFICEGLIHEKEALLLAPSRLANVSISFKTKASSVLKFIDRLPTEECPTSLVITLDDKRTITVMKNQLLGFSVDDFLTTSLNTSGIDITHNTLSSFSYEVFCNGTKNVSVIINQCFSATLPNSKWLNINVTTTIFLCDGSLVSRVSFTNPHAAMHPEGQWDLGDENSICFHCLSLKVAIKDGQSCLSINDAEFKATEGTPVYLYQASSGYDNWQSKVHVNEDNIVPLHFKGFEVSQNNNVLLTGQHAAPELAITRAESKASDESLLMQYRIGVEDFWQNFPSSIVQGYSEVIVSLLGADNYVSSNAPLIELQPGEQKSRCFWVSSRTIKPLPVQMNSAYFKSTECLPFLQTSACSLNNLINKAISGPSSFFQKRIDIDEFGWRHFGELYADHEKVLSPEVENFVSHYNNQYDPIYGMLCQWLATGDGKWFELADTLAKHVADIDVYHTSLDKPEYSGGLFWHTDHYVEAYTATHRTYSKRQPTDVYDDHAGGGGPGGQHCYTNGLTLHYLLTGNEVSKASVLSITDWIMHFYEGDNTLLSALIALKNSGAPGVKNVKTGKYPLDRGTANYIQALLDRHELLSNQSDVDRVSHIIRHTISPADTFEPLGDVESTWFYTVLLQAVCRFIVLKHQLHQYDEDYHYAVASLVHYAQWMTACEYAYLDKPSILEFPNQTWSGQDLRKICVLRFASNFLEREAALAAVVRADDLEQTVIKRLSSSDECESTRVLCLMMQNSNFMAYQNASHVVKNAYSNCKNVKSKEDKVLISSSANSSTAFILKQLRSFSFTREREQLVKRFPQFQKWLGKP